MNQDLGIYDKNEMFGQVISERSKSQNLHDVVRNNVNRDQLAMSYSTDFAPKEKRVLQLDNCKNELIELLQMIYTEDIFYSDLQQYFAFCFSRIENFGSFHQILYNSINSYLQVPIYIISKQIKSNIQELMDEIFDFSIAQKVQNCEPYQYFSKGIYKNFGKFSKKYSQIVLSLADFYDLVDVKGQVIQKIANHYMSYYHKHIKNNTVFQHIDCRELHNTLYTETILKDDAIKTFLDNLTILFQENKFYAQHYKQIMNKVEKLNQYRIIKHGSKMTTIDYGQINSDNDQNLKPKFIYVNTRFNSPSSSNKLYLSQSDKKTKSQQKPIKSKKKSQDIVSKYDEVKEFEKQIDMDFEQYKDIEKVGPNLTQAWIKKIKQKLIQKLKIL